MMLHATYVFLLDGRIGCSSLANVKYLKSEFMVLDWQRASNIIYAACRWDTFLRISL